jgi:hypothetical protein
MEAFAVVLQLSPRVAYIPREPEDHRWRRTRHCNFLGAGRCIGEHKTVTSHLAGQPAGMNGAHPPSASEPIGVPERAALDAISPSHKCLLENPPRRYGSFLVSLGPGRGRSRSACGRLRRLAF